MADINKLKDKIKSTIYPNGKGAINASDHQAMLLDMADGMAETDNKLIELSASKVEVSEGINLFNPNDTNVVLDHFMQIDGKLEESSSYNVSGYVAVEENTSYFASLDDPNGFRFVTYFDNKRNVIGGVSGPMRVFVTPVNCTYVRCTFYKGSYKSAQISKENTSWHPFDALSGYRKKATDYERVVLGNYAYYEFYNIGIGNVYVPTPKYATPYHRSAIVDVSEGGYLVITGTTERPYNLWGFLTENSVLIYTYPSKSANKLFINIPPEAKTFIYSALADSDAEVLYYKGKKYSPNFPSIEEVMDVVVNVFDATKIYESQVLEISAGATITTNDYHTSDYMNVVEGLTYKIFSGQELTNARFVCFYDSNKQYLQQSLALVNEFVAPSFACYCRISYYSSILSDTICVTNGIYNIPYGALVYSKNGAVIGENAYATKKYVDEHIVRQDTKDVLYGKKLVACGDSFTAYTNEQFADGIYKGKYKTYPYLIGLRTGMNVENKARSGMSMVKKDGSDNYFSGDYYKSIPIDADYIIIKLGINDVNYNSPMGTITDTDNTTFYGAWNVVMQHLLENYPYAKIGIIVTNGASLEIMEAEREIAKKWGVPFLDYGDYQTPLMGRMIGFRDGVIREAMLARHNAFKISDTDSHPNAKAHEYESTFIEAFLRRL